MTTAEMEMKIRTLERDVAALKALAAEPSSAPGSWRSTIGMFDGDSEYADVIRLGREYRRQQNEDKGE